MSSTNSPEIIHLVFFTLKDRSADAIDRLVDECKTKLDGHDGVLHFAVGKRGTGFDRPVNDQEFDVALHVVFENRAAHDKYQIAPLHVEFVEQNKDTWAQVRVFDSERS